MRFTVLNTSTNIERILCQFSSVAQFCPTLCDPMNRSMPGPSVHHQLLEFTQTHVHWVGDAIQPFILCRPLLLLPPIPPSLRVFSNASTLHLRWPKCWSFSFSISPSNEHPGLISFRMDWLHLLAVFPNTRVQKQQFFSAQLSSESSCNAGDLGSIPGLGRSPGGGHGKLLQYSCLENPTARGAWWATVHRVAKNWTQLWKEWC